MNDRLPKWIDFGVIPALNLLLAFVVTSLIILCIGENPIQVFQIMIQGAFGSMDGFGYTLFYATNYIFAGYAVAIAFQSNLFNIGAEGQGLMGGIGATIVILNFDSYQGLPSSLLILFAILAAMIAGGLWGLIAGWMQAYRNSHIVITTIMLNFIASSILILLLNGPMKTHGGAPESRVFAERAWMPTLKEFFHTHYPNVNYFASLNLAFILALLLGGCYLWYVWHTKWGYELRTLGQNPEAAKYAGIKDKKEILRVMFISGAFAGLMAINIVLGDTHSLKNGFIAGAGFTGIAVALMGRNHPIGIVLAAILFGAMNQGGSDLQMYVDRISPFFVNMTMGLVIYFSGALAMMFVPFFIKQFNKKRHARLIIADLAEKANDTMTDHDNRNNNKAINKEVL